MSNCKILSFVLLISLKYICADIIFGEEQVRLLQSSFEDCSASTNVEMEILTRARNNDFVQDPALMAYYHCMFRHGHLNFMSEDGSILRDNVRTFLHLEGDTEKWNEIIGNCFKMEGTGDLGLMTYSAVSCFTDKVGGRLNL